MLYRLDRFSFDGLFYLQIGLVNFRTIIVPPLEFILIISYSVSLNVVNLDNAAS